jgi:hypothetical protein
MAENKTKATEQSVGEFIAGLADERASKDSAMLVKMMRKATGEAPRMWGSAMVGFGERHYVYESGREGDTFLIGFSPRKAALTLYGLGLERQAKILAKLGKFTTGKGCLDVAVLQALIDGAAGGAPKIGPVKKAVVKKAAKRATKSL